MAELGWLKLLTSVSLCASARGGRTRNVASTTRNPAARAARDRRRGLPGLALLSLGSAFLASTAWLDGLLASICDEPRAGKNETVCFANDLCGPPDARTGALGGALRPLRWSVLNLMEMSGWAALKTASRGGGLAVARYTAPDVVS